MTVAPARSDHLVALIADVAAVAARVAGADACAREAQAAAARRESARLSARLDASPLTDATADAVDERLAHGLAPVDSPAGAGSPAARVTDGWARALKIDQAATQEVAAVEYANLLACFDAEPSVARGVLHRPREALAELHALICRDLIDAGSAGQPRRTQQAVHDGAQGRVLYRAVEPEHVGGLLDGLAAWLAGPAHEEPALVVAGTVQERILRWQPFEAGNGRVARAASRVVLRARGVDPQGLAVAERLPAADPLGYHREVAAGMHRRDLGPWLERAAEAVLSGLIAAAEAVDPAGRPQPPVRAAAVVDGLDADEVVTVTDYAARAGVDRDVARADLRALVLAGRVEAVTGSGGLRVRARPPAAGPVATLPTASADGDG